MKPVDTREKGMYIKYIPLQKPAHMKTLSLKLDDGIFEATEKILSKSQMNRNRYINEAVDFYNRLHQRKLLALQLKKESKAVARESMRILAEFDYK